MVDIPELTIEDYENGDVHIFGPAQAFFFFYDKANDGICVHFAGRELKAKRLYVYVACHSVNCPMGPDTGPKMAMEGLARSYRLFKNKEILVIGLDEAL